MCFLKFVFYMDESVLYPWSIPVYHPSTGTSFRLSNPNLRDGNNWINSLNFLTSRIVC